MEETLSRQMKFNRKDLTDSELMDLYYGMLKPRLIEDKMLILLRQGKISKWFSGYGQEATSVGSAMALEMDEYILPMHRNLGVFTSRKVDLGQLFAQFQGKKAGFTNGRDRSFHFGSKDHHLVGMISHLGPQLGIADGIALGNKIRGEEKATLVFTGDGGASEGDFHEALNVAAVWDLPVIFVVENNQWGLSTPSNEQFRCKQFIDKGIGYGMQAYQVNGNNILEVHDTIKTLARKLRDNPKPVLVEAMTFRIRGHEEASGTKYYPEGLIESWEPKDPIANFEAYLIEEGVLTEEKKKEMVTTIKKEIQDGLDFAFNQPEISAEVGTELGDVYKPHVQELVSPASSETKELRFIDAIQNALDQSMDKYPELVLMGQDIAEYGGVFKATEGFVEKYGKDRVRNTPLCESAIVGTALGLSINGMKAMSEMQFADFVTCGFNQIVNNLAKLHYRWGENADVVVRMPTGAGSAAGPFHSQSNEAWFFHVPGLKILYPSNPTDAKGMLNAAFEDPNPVMFFEHKGLYRSIKEEVPVDYYTTEIGKAAYAATGDDLTIITYGMGVHWALDAVKKHSIDATIVDLRTLLPLDMETVYEAAKATGKVLVLHEDNLTGGIGGEIAALISEHCFEFLDAPVARIGAMDTPIPFAANLENQFLPQKRFEDKLLELNAF